jgi:multisubunit Na+/H+ antiporter MnhE subunit
VSGQSRRALLTRAAFGWLTAAVFAAAFYLLLIDTTDLPELIVGGVAAALAATGSELARQQRVVGESLRLRWLGRLYRPLLRVPLDVAQLSAAAVRQLLHPRARVGEFRTVKFICSGDERRDDGRAALAIAAGSFAPNTMVVGIDHERNVMLVHQLRASDGADTVDLLELGEA